MRPSDPPEPLPRPRIVTLAEGTALWRVHSVNRDACALNATAQSGPRKGNRFDSEDGAFAYTYVGDSPEAAIAETLCRNLPVDQLPRLIPRKQVADRVLSAIHVRETVQVVDLTGAGLAQVNAGIWLTKCDPSGYPHTRRWARALLASSVDAAGLQYRPRHDENRLAWMLCAAPPQLTHPALEQRGVQLPLDSVEGRLLLSRILARHNAALA